MTITMKAFFQLKLSLPYPYLSNCKGGDFQSFNVFDTKNVKYNYSDFGCIATKWQQEALDRCKCVYAIWPFEHLIKPNETLNICEENNATCNITHTDEQVQLSICNCQF